MNNFFKNAILRFWFVLILIVVVTFGFLKYKKTYPDFTRITYSQFIEKIHNGDVSEIVVDRKYIDGITFSGDLFSTYAPGKLDVQILEKEWIDHYGIGVQAIPPKTESFLVRIFLSWFPTVIFIVVWIYLIRQMEGRGAGIMSFGKSKASLICEKSVKVKFNDVAGIEDAKEELYEVVDFLCDPNKFSSLGARIPTGVLLVGRPGTGKTLLSKAVAGEAGVPFFTISGSNFVEMFVGVGASRVRDMFAQARTKAPCIIFIDEIDAIGRSRGGSGNKGVNDEREQTLNQLLVEMDGFEKNEGTIVIGATNRPDVLDPALLRSGRFSRKVYIDLPDLEGREQILKVHTRGIPLASSVNIRTIACGTVGMSGADLANLANESALLAARMNKLLIHMEQFDQAKDRILIGLARKSMVLDYNERKLTAYHEAGHAIVGLNIPGHDPVYKISIVPRANALGMTVFLPEREKHSYSYSFLCGQIASLFGGRVAEEIIFGRGCVTTGASNDIKRATELCRKIVTQWGLSDKIGPIALDLDGGEEFFPGGNRNFFSESTGKLIDVEIARLTEKLYKLSSDILLQNIEQLHKMAEALLLHETITSTQIIKIMKEN